MKLSSVLGTILLGSLLACSGSKDESPAGQPAAATTPESSTDSTKPEDDTADSTTDAPAPATDPAATTDPAETSPEAAGPETCESLAAKAETPAGKLTDVTAVSGSFDIDPIDVYATEDEDGLHIILTETANACAYHANKLQSAHLNELAIDFPKGDAEFGPGTFKPSSFSQEAGTACFAEDQFGQIGTAWAGGGARGKLTITAKTASLVEGTVDIKDPNGSKTTFTFRAPICAKAEPTDELTCCAAE